MIKTITLDGLTSVTVKESPFDMARFCWVRNRTESDVYISCTDPQCTPNADGVKCISAGECGMLDSESRETLYISGSGVVNIETTPFLVCPFPNGVKGGESGGGGRLTEIYRGAFSSSSLNPTVFDCDISEYTAIILCPVFTSRTHTIETTTIVYEQLCLTTIYPTCKIMDDHYNEFVICGYPYSSSSVRNAMGYIKCDNGKCSVYTNDPFFSGIIIYGI